MSVRQDRSHSFTGVTCDKGSVLKQDRFDKVTRKDLESIYEQNKQPPRLRRLSLTTTTHYDDPYKKRSLNQYKLERSLSLPDRKSLANLEQSQHSFLPHAHTLVKTRSVTFHPETICLNAAADNDIEELEDILQNDIVDINYKNSCGLSMMHQAAATGSFEAIQLLIENEAEVNCVDQRGLTPLDLAIRGGFFDCALVLINAGARVEKIINGLQ